MNTSEKLLTIGEIAEMCQISPRTVYRWLAEGWLRALRIGNMTRVRRQDLDEFFEANIGTVTKGNPRS